MLLPLLLLKKFLFKNGTWRLYLQYHRALKKRLHSELRIIFLKSCLSNDLIPKFLSFRLPENGVFDDKTVHNFRRKLLRSELSKAHEAKLNSTTKTDEIRRLLADACGVFFLHSVVFYTRQFMRDVTRKTKHTHEKKKQFLSERHSKPLRTVKDTVEILDDSISPPSWVTDLLSLGPKHPILDKFRELHFLADVDSLLRTLKENNASNDCLNDVNALAQWYVKKAKQQRPDRAPSKVNHYLKRNDIKAVPYDKGSGFALMTSNQYETKLLEVLSGDQFQALRAVKGKPLLLKIEERFNKSQQTLCDHGSISQAFYQSTRATGSQPARLYGLAKVHKDNVPLRPVLSLPASCYHKLNKVLSRFFDKVPGANIETCTPAMKELLASSTIDEDETIFSLDVESLYTNVPVQEAIIHAVDCLYSFECVPEFEKDVFIQLMKLAVTDVHFMACGQWFLQKDGVAMGSSLAVILAHLWLKKFEEKIRLEVTRPPSTVESNLFKVCLELVTREGSFVLCDCCCTWCHEACIGVAVSEVTNSESFCSACTEYNRTIETCKVFGRYVDDVKRSSKVANFESISSFVKSLHDNLEFTIERLNDRKIPFLDLLVTLRDKKLNTEWYLKPTDTGILLNFRATAPIRFKKNIIQGTVHRIFNATSDWSSFHAAIERACVCFEQNQNPPVFYQPIIRNTITKILTTEGTPTSEDLKKPEKPTSCEFSK